MQHPEEGLIHAWLDGALPANEAAALESHVATCKECEARVAEARGLIAASSRIVGHLDAVPANVIPAAPAKRRLPSWRSPWVAAIAAGLILSVRGYLNSPDSGAPELPSAVQQTPGVIRPGVTESMPVSPPQTNAEPQQAKSPVAQSRLAQAVADSATSTKATSSPTLPPPNAAAQKMTIAAAQPTAAPRPTNSAPATIPEVRADVQASAERRRAATATTGAAAGMAAGAAAPPAALRQARDMALDDSPPVFVGCYEMNASTGILPARFALAADSSTMPGLLRIRYVDTDGRATSSIPDLGWSIEGGQVVVKTQAQETLLTLRKTGSAVAGESRSGSRNGRVTSCSR